MTWFTETDLRHRAGESSFRRGREYVDAVGELRPTALGVRASVRGKDVRERPPASGLSEQRSELGHERVSSAGREDAGYRPRTAERSEAIHYEVWLGRENETLVGECECPFGLEGNFCKHCVAVGLVVLSSAEDGPDLAGYLQSLDRQELVDLLLTQARRDETLCRQLMLRAGSTGAPQVAVLRRQLDEALTVRGYVDGDYAARGRDVLDTVQALVDAGHAAEARPLARHAVERLASAIGAVDDPAETVAGLCRRAIKLYAGACESARPNPAKLAAWLYRLRVSWTTWPTFDLGDFLPALGDAGLAEYTRLVDEAWAALADDADPAVLRGMREQLARTTGDVDKMVAVLSDGLPAPKAYRGIVELLRAAGRTASAVEWAERGGEAELLVETYLAVGRGEDAVEVRKKALREAPTRLCYARLRETAVEAGLWEGLRSWALAVVPSSELVGVLLDEGLVEEAWETAVKYDCVDLEVARLRGVTHPEDVVVVYQGLVEECLGRSGRDAYRQAGILLQEMVGAADRSGVSVGEFVGALKARNSRRPALLDELKRAGF